MTTPWSGEDLARFAVQEELEIAAPRADGTRGRWTPIWVVVASGGVYVRTWQRRTTGWYGHAVSAGRAWVRLADRDLQVAVSPVEDMHTGAIDRSYGEKYGSWRSGSMTLTEESRLSTLRLDPIG